MDGNKLPTTSCHQSRLQIFQPTKKPHFKERNVLVTWGHARIIGSLGQVHATTLEAIFFNCEKFNKLSEGRVELIVDPYKIRRTLGGGKQYSYTTLNKMINDLMSALIELKVKKPAFSIIKTHIIEKVTFSQLQKPNPLARLIKARGSTKYRFMWSITISSEFMNLLRSDLLLYYDPMPICKLRTGVGQAVARFLLTHSKKNQLNNGWNIDTLLLAVGVEDHSLRDRRKDIKLDALLLKELGILVDGEKITLTKI
jgi:hypothetical protein